MLDRELVHSLILILCESDHPARRVVKLTEGHAFDGSARADVRNECREVDLAYPSYSHLQNRLHLFYRHKALLHYIDRDCKNTSIYRR